MDRELLFQSKRMDNGEWVYGVPLYDLAECSLKKQGKCKCAHNGELITFFAWEDDCHEYAEVEVDPSTVGQYTGKNDRNQHRAFVGDIVRYRNEQHTVYGIIRFGEITDTEVRSKHIGYYIEWQNDGANMWGDWWRRDLGYWLDDPHCEICGNIHDNPELIGGDGDG